MAEYYGNNDYRDYLEHHGIPKMKWGVKNGPPYPLSKEAHGRVTSGRSNFSNAKSVTKSRLSKEQAEKFEDSKSSTRKAGFREFGGYHGEVRSSERTNNNSTKNEAWRNIKPETDMTYDDAVDFIKQMGERLSRETSGRDKPKIFQSRKAKREAEEAARREAEKAEAAKAAEERRRAHEEEKQKAITSGDYELVKKYFNELTPAQLDEAISKVEANRRLEKNAPKQKSSMDTINDAINKIDKVRGWVEKGIDVYNVGAKIYNSTHADKQVPVVVKDNQFWQQKNDKNLANQRDKMLSAIFDSGNAKDINKALADMSDQEIQSKVNRMNNIETIRNKVNKKPNSNGGGNNGGNNNNKDEDKNKNKNK